MIDITVMKLAVEVSNSIQGQRSWCRVQSWGGLAFCQWGPYPYVICPSTSPEHACGSDECGIRCACVVICINVSMWRPGGSQRRRVEPTNAARHPPIHAVGTEQCWTAGRSDTRKGRGATGVGESLCCLGDCIGTARAQPRPVSPRELTNSQRSKVS